MMANLNDPEVWEETSPPWWAKMVNDGAAHSCPEEIDERKSAVEQMRKERRHAPIPDPVMLGLYPLRPKFDQPLDQPIVIGPQGVWIVPPEVIPSLRTFLANGSMEGAYGAHGMAKIAGDVGFGLPDAPKVAAAPPSPTKSEPLPARALRPGRHDGGLRMPRGF